MSWPPGGILVIAGPTAAGKTELAVRLARELNGEIISADSRQIYQGLDVGAGKPDPAQLAVVPHHLISAVPPDETVTAVDYALRAEAARAEITARGRTCLLVGGTGLWIRAFVDGLDPAPPPDPDLRARLMARAETEGRPALHAELAQIDPASAERIAPADLVRVIRALEIHALTGQRPSDLRGAGRDPKPSLWLGVTRPRAELYARAEARIDDWLSTGWLEETRRLLKSGLPADAPALQALGYSHLIRHLRGEKDLDLAGELIRRDTRRYIKRQLTWFSSETRMHWLDAHTGDEAMHAEARKILADAGWI